MVVAPDKIMTSENPANAVSTAKNPRAALPRSFKPAAGRIPAVNGAMIAMRPIPDGTKKVRITDSVSKPHSNWVGDEPTLLIKRNPIRLARPVRAAASAIRSELKRNQVVEFTKPLKATENLAT